MPAENSSAESLNELLKKANQLLAKSAADDEDKKENKGGDEETKKRRPAARARANDLLDMDRGGFVDRYMPHSWGGSRAGRATQIAKALGKDPGFTVKHPYTSSILGTYAGLGGGMGLGALGGAGLGALVGALGEANGGMARPGEYAALGAALGTGIGGLGGMFGGMHMTGSRRRENMKNIRQALEDELAQNRGANLKPQRPEFGVLSSLLLPLSGAHRAGQADAYRALKDNARYPSMTGRNVAYAGDFVPYANNLITPVRGIAQNFNARARVNKDKAQDTVSGEDYNYGLDIMPKAASARDFGEKESADYDNLHADALSALGGGALGAGLGGLYGAVTGGKGDRLRKALRSAVFGGLTGAGAGFGASYLGRNSVNEQNEADIKREMLRNLIRDADKSGVQPTSVFNDTMSMPGQHANDVAAAREPAGFLGGGLVGAGLGALASRGSDVKKKKKDEEEKVASAFEFGSKVANIFPIVPGTPLATTPKDWAAVGGAGGAALGAGLGGLYGLVNPGKDEQGKRKSRLMAALKGALGGGVLGGGVGAGVGYFSPETANKALQGAQSLLPIGRSPMDYKGRLGNIRNLFDADGRINKVQTDTREQFDLMADNPPTSVGRDGKGVPALIEHK